MCYGTDVRCHGLMFDVVGVLCGCLCDREFGVDAVIVCVWCVVICVLRGVVLSFRFAVLRSGGSGVCF